MSCTDPIADALTVIRNGINSRKKSVKFPHSSIKEAVMRVLAEEGYLSRVDVLDTAPARTIQVGLKYSDIGESVIHSLVRESTPGRRVYGGKAELSNPVIGGFGIRIVSTSKGVLSDRACRAQGIGGEILCEVR